MSFPHPTPPAEANAPGRKPAETPVAPTLSAFDLAAAGANDGLWEWDLHRNLMIVSDRWKQVIGFDPHDLPSTLSPEQWLGRIHSEDAPRLRAGLYDYLAEPCHGPGLSVAPFTAEYRLLDKAGQYRWVLCRAAVLRDEHGVASRIGGSHTDLTERKLAERLCRDAYHDSLTGLANQPLLLDRLAVCLARARRQNSFGFAVLALDVDRLRVVNDTLGQVAGDELLAAVSARLSACVRGLDLVARHSTGEPLQPGDAGALARIGGDEFVVVLDGIHDGTGAVRVAERVQAAMAQPLRIAGQEVFCTVSIGIALGHAKYEKPEDLIRDAETALYEAKAGGPGRYQIFDADHRAAVMARWRTENDLRRAIDRGELLLHYQPIVDLQTGEIVEFESLVRWKHPERGLIPPNEFITLAEQTGLIVPLGYWVLREACRQLHRWRSQLAGLPPISVAVNVSPRQFDQPKLLDEVSRIIREAQIPANLLRLEITESGLLQETPASRHNLDRLRGLDLQLHLDDFGTGYSSLACLHRLPISALKIDRSFVSTLGSDPVSGSIIETVVTLASRMELQVIAEGIETEAQAAWLREAGVGCGQGYLYSRPVPAEAATELLRNCRRLPQVRVA